MLRYVIDLPPDHRSLSTVQEAAVKPMAPRRSEPPEEPEAPEEAEAPPAHEEPSPPEATDKPQASARPPRMSEEETSKAWEQVLQMQVRTEPMHASPP